MNKNNISKIEVLVEELTKLHDLTLNNMIFTGFNLTGNSTFNALRENYFNGILLKSCAIWVDKSSNKQNCSIYNIASRSKNDQFKNTFKEYYDLKLPNHKLNIQLNYLYKIFSNVRNKKIAHISNSSIDKFDVLIGHIDVLYTDIVKLLKQYPSSVIPNINILSSRDKLFNTRCLCNDIVGIKQIIDKMHDICKVVNTNIEE